MSNLKKIEQIKKLPDERKNEKKPKEEKSNVREKYSDGPLRVVASWPKIAPNRFWSIQPASQGTRGQYYEFPY